MELQEPRNVSWTYSTSDIIASSTPRQRYIIMPTIFDLSQSSLSMRVGWYNIPWQTFMVHSDLNSPIVGAGISLFGKLAQHLGLHLFNSCSPCATQHCRILHKKTPLLLLLASTRSSTQSLPLPTQSIHSAKGGSGKTRPCWCSAPVLTWCCWHWRQLLSRNTMI